MRMPVSLPNALTRRRRSKGRRIGRERKLLPSKFRTVVNNSWSPSFFSLKYLIQGHLEKPGPARCSEGVHQGMNTSAFLRDASLPQPIALWRMLKKEHPIFMTQADFVVNNA